MKGYKQMTGEEIMNSENEDLIKQHVLEAFIDEFLYCKPSNLRKPDKTEIYVSIQESVAFEPHGEINSLMDIYELYREFAQIKQYPTVPYENFFVYLLDCSKQVGHTILFSLMFKDVLRWCRKFNTWFFCDDGRWRDFVLAGAKAEPHDVLEEIYSSCFPESDRNIWRAIGKGDDLLYLVGVYSIYLRQFANMYGKVYAEEFYGDCKYVDKGVKDFWDGVIYRLGETSDQRKIINEAKRFLYVSKSDLLGETALKREERAKCNSRRMIF